MRLDNICPNVGMETISMNTENKKTSESHKFVLDLSQRLDFKSLNKYVVVQNLSIYYISNNKRKQYNNNKPNICI